MSYSRFSEEYELAKEKQLVKELDELLKEIDREGKEMINNPTFERLTSYKKLITGFMNTVLDRLYKLKTRKGVLKDGRQRVHYVLEQLDGRLKELTDRVLDSQTEPIDLIGTIDEIRGLLLDLYS